MPSRDEDSAADQLAPHLASDATQLLGAAARGDAAAAQEALRRVYDQLRDLAAGFMSRERVDHTLQPTALVNEAWIRLSGQRDVAWESRAHFLALAATSMRRILVDHARGRAREKRGAGPAREPLDDTLRDAFRIDFDVLTLNEGLEALALESARAARVVELRFFAGLTEPEAARVLGVGTATVERDWRAARAWLSDWMARGEGT